ncbi:RRP15-like protein isoform X2 [Lepidochelys kempii]|uniref:RRP15-like protein isoform X2 n=1 Tax=Lepidochelys kempii TaxID=8472 RepID=UPI003C701098
MHILRTFHFISNCKPRMTLSTINIFFKSANLENLYPRILKETAWGISGLLALIFRKSWNTREIPEDWKSANVMPIFKKGKQEDPGSERSSELPEDDFSSEGEALDGDDEDEAMAHAKMDENEAESQAGPSAGWAEAMAKVLNKKIPKSKSTILVKSKELEKEREREKQEKLEKKRQLDKKREWEMMCRVKPDVAKDRERERNFQRIATRGVVQLFNAVRKHQKNVDEKVKEAGNSNRKRAKLMSSVSKKDFINMLRGNEVAKREQSISGKTLKSKQLTSYGNSQFVP